MIVLLLVLIAFCVLWWYGAKHQEDLTKADYLSKYGQADFIQKFGQEEFNRLHK